MHSTYKFLIAITLAAPLAACSGGAGSGGNSSANSGDVAPISGEFPEVSGDVPPTSGDVAPTSGEGTSLPFACSGKWTCLVSQAGKKDDTDNLSLKPVGRDCLADKILLKTNGSVSLEGQTIGTWVSSGAAATINIRTTAGTARAVCRVK